MPKCYKRTQSKDANKQSSSSREWRVEFRDASLPGYEHGIEFTWQLQNNGKKGTKLEKEDFMCDLKSTVRL
jgi:hypothetical protein